LSAGLDTGDKKMTEFEQGILYAVGLIIALCDEPVIAASVVREAGLGNTDISGLDYYDKSNLAKLKNEKGINFRGV
jgi:hypothetical protein